MNQHLQAWHTHILSLEMMRMPLLLDAMAQQTAPWWSLLSGQRRPNHHPKCPLIFRKWDASFLCQWAAYPPVAYFPHPGGFPLKNSPGGKQPLSWGSMHWDHTWSFGPWWLYFSPGNIWYMPALSPYMFLWLGKRSILSFSLGKERSKYFPLWHISLRNWSFQMVIFFAICWRYRKDR